MRVEDFTIGADPEIFVGQDGVFQSAHDMVPGFKWNPHKVDKGAVQVDGMALEFNIDPVNTYEAFQHNLDTVRQQLSEMIRPFNVDFLQEVSVFFDQNYLDTIPIMNKELGCQSDFNAWVMDENRPPNSRKLMRTAGGHIHIGGFPTEEEYDPEHFEKAASMARLLDEEIGVYSILWDTDDQRRGMYGKAGSFRPKTYGMEYRTLSSKWLFKPQLTKFVFDGALRAFTRFVEGDITTGEDVQTIIDRSQRDHPLFDGNCLADQARAA